MLNFSHAALLLSQHWKDFGVCFWEISPKLVANPESQASWSQFCCAALPKPFLQHRGPVTYSQMKRLVPNIWLEISFDAQAPVLYLDSSSETTETSLGLKNLLGTAVHWKRWCHANATTPNFMSVAALSQESASLSLEIWLSRRINQKHTFPDSTNKKCRFNYWNGHWLIQPRQWYPSEGRCKNSNNKTLAWSNEDKLSSRMLCGLASLTVTSSTWHKF